MYLDPKPYNEKYPLFDESIRGKALISVGEITIISLGYFGLGKGVQINQSDIRIGYATGRYIKKSDKEYYFQVEFEQPFGTDELRYYSFGYIYGKDYRIFQMENKKGATNLINNLVENNKEILENNLLCAGIISKAQKRGGKIPPKYITELKRLHSNLQKRNEILKNSTFLKTKEASPKGFNRYTQKLNDISNSRISGTTLLDVDKCLPNRTGSNEQQTFVTNWLLTDQAHCQVLNWSYTYYG